MERLESYSAAEGQQKLRDFLSEALPIINWLPVVFSRNGGLLTVPLIQVATRGRPDVADLPRVHVLEGPEGDVWSQWIMVTGQDPIRVLLDVELQRPVVCRFSLAFRVDRHRRLLEGAAASGIVGLAFGQVHVDRHMMIRGPGLMIETPARELRSFLVAAAIVETAMKAA